MLAFAYFKVVCPIVPKSKKINTIDVRVTERLALIVLVLGGVNAIFNADHHLRHCRVRAGIRARVSVRVEVRLW